MKTSIILVAFLAFQMNTFSQGMNIKADNKQCVGINTCATKSLPGNDIAIIKPLINTNDTNGGYYSEYYTSAFNFMHCGVIVKNVGINSANNVHLELSVKDYYQNVLETYYSDSLTTMNPGEVDTLYIPGELTFANWINGDYHLFFLVKCDFNDENPANNVYSVPFTHFSDWMWTLVSRSIYMTNSYNISQIPNFHSGDFLGFTLSIPNGYHQIAYLGVYLSYPWPDSLKMTAKIFRNGVLADTSASFYLPSPPQAGWAYSDMFWPFDELLPDSLYYVGIEFSYKQGTDVMIGADTSSYHNFPAETVAKIGNNWTTLNFVPLIQLICDPEGINEKGNDNKVKAYPNPTSGTIFIDNAGGSKIELYDLTGDLLLTDHNTNSHRTIDITFLPAGVYILRIQNNHEVISRRILVMK